MKLIKTCLVCKRFRAFHKQGCPGMRIYTKKERVAGFLIILKNQIASLLLAMGCFYALAGAWTEYNVPAGEEDRLVMAIRPNAPGSYAALLEKHSDHCWTDSNPLGRTDSAIVRINPSDPYIHTRKPRLIDRALDQAVHHKDRNLDQVLAFCTDDITKPSKLNVKMAF